MMNGVNKVILVGSVGKDPEVKYMPSGGAVVNLSVATNESWKDKTTGEKKERTEWHRVTFYQKLAEIVGQYVRKGQQIYVEGRLQTRDYEKDGQKHYSTEVIASTMQMLGAKTPSAAKPSSSREPGSDDSFQDDELPPQ